TCDAPAPQHKKPAKTDQAKAHKTPLKTPAAPVKTAPSPASGVLASASAPDGTPVINVAAESKRIVLRYRILDANQGDREIDGDNKFYSKDRIKLAVETNSAGYLYVINQGSSTKWRVMFPDPDIDHGNNSVDGRREYILPGQDNPMRFDNQPGTEHLFIAF